MSLTPYTSLLSQAQNARSTAEANSTTSRIVLADKQDQKHRAYTQLQALRHKTKGFEVRSRPKQFHTLLTAHLTASLLTAKLAAAVRTAADMLVVREKELHQARTEENEIRLRHDTCLLNKGKLRSISPPSNNDKPPQIWRTEVDLAFTSYTTMTTFSSPSPLREGATHTLSCPDCDTPSPLAISIGSYASILRASCTSACGDPGW
ncbi:hypothetical protein LTR17_024824 [Elasticomyces elasticus]|nr:hypothetical protein LTR17_024824 [Elasticomyces elasticus]